MTTLVAPSVVAPDLARCDSCPQAGTTRYVLPSGLDLVLCGHHSREYGPGLRAAAAHPQEVAR